MIAFIKSLEGERETYSNTNGRVYICIRKIDLLLPNETCFHSQITFTTSNLYYLMVPSVTDYKFNLYATKFLNYLAIFPIMTSNFVVYIVHILLRRL